MHDRILKSIKTAEESPGDTALKKKKQRALIQLRYDNRNSFLRKELADKQIRIDELNRSLSRKAADPTADLQALQPILDQIASLRADIAKLSSEVHFEALHHVPNMIDDARSALSTGTFDDAVLLWDRRPFEPLHIQPQELYPRETDMTMIYFEADANSPITRLSNQVDEASRAKLYRIYEAVSLIFGSRGAMPVSELLNSLFPSRPINDLVRAIPSLATHAARTPKPNFDDLPKTVHCRPGEDPSKPLDPVSNFQENLDYDLSDVRIRCLSPITLWEIILEYQKDNNTEVNVVQLNRLLGGTLTSFRAGEYGVDPKKLR
jgi:transcription factor 1